MTELDAGGQPIMVAYPNPLAQPQVDAYTTLLSTLGSSSAITSPQAGPGGTLNLQDGSFHSSVFGGGVLLNNGSVTFPASCFSAQVGTLEMWVEPQWNGSAAPSWATFFLRTSSSGWGKSMWDLHMNAGGGTSQLIWALSDDYGTERDLSATTTNWVAGQAHHIMLTWNAYTGYTALYVDGVLAQENTVAGGLTLNSTGNAIMVNDASGRAAGNAAYGPIRLSSVQRSAGQRRAFPDVDIRSVGLELPIQ